MWRLAICSSILFAFFHVHQAQTCNETVCRSIVSKCLITESCKCDLTNCTCCKDCFSCLSFLYDECCSCVDMCLIPKQIYQYQPKQVAFGLAWLDSVMRALSKKSRVEDFPESVPGLFNALTESPDNLNRWNSTTFPVDIDISQYAPKKEVKIHMQSAEQEVVPMKSNIITLNCTVAFMPNCMGWVKCKSSCQTMGASSYRWFHDGCCECIGQNCINYGINESRCRECPIRDDEETLEDEDEDYGQESDNDDQD